MDIKSYATYFQVNHPYYSSSDSYLYKGDVYRKDKTYTLFLDYKDLQRVLAHFRRWEKYYTRRGYWILKISGKDIPYVLPLLKHEYTISDCDAF